MCESALNRLQTAGFSRKLEVLTTLTSGCDDVTVAPIKEHLQSAGRCHGWSQQCDVIDTERELLKDVQTWHNHVHLQEKTVERTKNYLQWNLGSRT
jgi:hypothetical protein